MENSISEPMNYFPPHFRHIDWATYGLSCLQNLSSEPPPKVDRCLELFSEITPYKIDNAVCSDCDQSLNEYFQCAELTTFHKWLMHKQVSAGIRFAFSSDLEVIRIRLNCSQDRDKPARVAYDLSDGTQFVLESVVDAKVSTSDDILLQGGNPSNWYNLHYWRRLHPMRSTDGVTEQSGSLPVNNNRFSRLARSKGGTKRFLEDTISTPGVD